MPRKIARMSKDIPLSQADVLEQLRDVETMFRLNPHLTVNRFSLSSGSKMEPGSEISVDFDDYVTEAQYSLKATCNEYRPDSGWILEYSSGNKLTTALFVVNLNGSSRITLEETYKDEESENFDWHQQQLDYWLRSIEAYLILISRKGPRASLSKWFMRRLWIPAGPSGRNTSLLILRISLVEIALIVAIIVMWALFMQK